MAAATVQANRRVVRSGLSVRASAQADVSIVEASKRQMLLGFASLGLASGFSGIASADGRCSQIGRSALPVIARFKWTQLADAHGVGFNGGP